MLGVQLIGENFHNNARVPKVILKHFQCSRVLSIVTQINLIFFLGFSYDRIWQVCYTVCIRKTDIIEDKVEKNLSTNGISLGFHCIWKCYRWKFN